MVGPIHMLGAPSPCTDTPETIYSILGTCLSSPLPSLFNCMLHALSQVPDTDDEDDTQGDVAGSLLDSLWEDLSLIHI